MDALPSTPCEQSQARIESRLIQRFIKGVKPDCPPLTYKQNTGDVDNLPEAYTLLTTPEHRSEYRMTGESS